MRVVAGIMLQDGEVFACRRNPGRTFAGRWEFPGGKVEVGETDQAALARELAEELHLEVTVGRLFRRDTTTADNLEIDMSCYEVSIVGPPPTVSTDHDELLWINLREVASFDWAPADWPMVRTLAAMAGQERDQSSTESVG